ncbi:MAG: BrnA antitoxin family protein [Giesbergeria sp.]|uniref:BrnA antitoxin family protein n=1 Tax=Giesbergeria sp. TaxID=2818473 RepID=UPI00262FD2E9|nr:BrnA antitoxin family protein [Giesbergeria sp.]MDD2609903.1 BrnA antitoxin family protein [Giesbergeria sp.]
MPIFPSSLATRPLVAYYYRFSQSSSTRNDEEPAQSGEFARVHTPADIAARRKAGRPVGTLKAAPKQATTIRLSPEVMAAFKATGKGWQTRIDAALKDWLQTHSPAQ